MSRMKLPRTFAAIVVGLVFCTTLPARGQQEVIVLSSFDEGMDWLTSEGWWGEESWVAPLDVPHAIITGINPRWREAAQQLPVEQKKEIFYRFMLPLIVYANGIVMSQRTWLLDVREQIEAGAPDAIDPADLELIREVAVFLNVTDAEHAADLTADSDELPRVLDDLVHRVDVIPNGLALGQAAYESGYGTSDFTVEGNALFGQWTYNGKGMVPGQQRSELGDHRIAAFDWPFDSVRGYFINLMSHAAYEEFRKLRAELRAAGKPLDSMSLADGLTSYSERGQDYVDSLKGMIRVNKLDVADGAEFRDEPLRFLVGAEDAAEKEKFEQEIERLRETGELAKIIERMRLE